MRSSTILKPSPSDRYLTSFYIRENAKIFSKLKSHDYINKKLKLVSDNNDTYVDHVIFDINTYGACSFLRPSYNAHGQQVTGDELVHIYNGSYDYNIFNIELNNLKFKSKCDKNYYYLLWSEANKVGKTDNNKKFLFPNFKIKTMSSTGVFFEDSILLLDYSSYQMSERYLIANSYKEILLFMFKEFRFFNQAIMLNRVSDLEIYEWVKSISDNIAKFIVSCYFNITDLANGMVLAGFSIVAEHHGRYYDNFNNPWGKPKYFSKLSISGKYGLDMIKVDHDASLYIESKPNSSALITDLGFCGLKYSERAVAIGLGKDKLHVIPSPIKVFDDKSSKTLDYNLTVATKYIPRKFWLVKKEFIDWGFKHLTERLKSDPSQKFQVVLDPNFVNNPEACGAQVFNKNKYAVVLRDAYVQ